MTDLVTVLTTVFYTIKVRKIIFATIFLQDSRSQLKQTPLENNGIYVCSLFRRRAVVDLLVGIEDVIDEHRSGTGVEKDI